MTIPQMDPSAFPTVATVIGFTPDSDSGPLVATLACPITSEELETPVAGHESPSANIVETIHMETNDPITKALVDNIVGNLPTKKPVVKLRCDICNIEVSGKAVLEMHLAGAKHFKKMKLIESLAKGQEKAEVCKVTPPNPLLCFKCEVCNVSVNSIQQLQVHSQGTKHKNNVENLSKKQNKLLEQEPLCCHPAHPGFAVTKFSCSTRNVTVNSANQLEQHEASIKHTEIISSNVSTSNNNRFESYSRADVTQPDNPLTSENFVQKRNISLSSSNHNNRFEPYSRERRLDRETPVLSTGAADAQFSCSVCKIMLNSATQLQQHEASKKHAEKVTGHARPIDTVEQTKILNGNYITKRTTVNPLTSGKFVQKRNISLSSSNHNNKFEPYSRERRLDRETPVLGSTGAADAQFSCSVCEIKLNSAIQLQQHEASKKHAEKVTGHARPIDTVEQTKILNGNYITKRTTVNPLTSGKFVQKRNVSLSSSNHNNKIEPYSRERRLDRETPVLSTGAADAQFSCSVCEIKLNSAIQLQQHEASNKHADKVTGHARPIDTVEQTKIVNKRTTDNPLTPGNFVQKRNISLSSSNHNNRFEPYSRERRLDRETPVLGSFGAADAQFSCSVCKINLNSAIQLQQHEASKKHAEKVTGHARPSDTVEQTKILNAKSSCTSEESGQSYYFADLRGRPHSEGAKSSGGVKSFKCDACNVYTNSMAQLQQHYQSWKHIEKVEGTPAFKDRTTLNIPPQTHLTKNFFERPLVKSMSDNSAGPHKFNNSTVHKRSDFVSSHQPFLNRLLNNLKSISDQRVDRKSILPKLETSIELVKQ